MSFAGPSYWLGLARKRDLVGPLMNHSAMLAAGFFLCILWITIIRNYKMLNKAKYSIILQLEELLPFSPFKMEWEEIKTLKKYKELTLLEFSLPILFMVLFVSALIVIF